MRAAAWLSNVDLDLVVQWLDYLESLPDQERRSQFHNESALLNSMVQRQIPPTPAQAGGAAAVCPKCGQPWFDKAGRCLVCSGAIKI